MTTATATHISCKAFVNYYGANIFAVHVEIVGWEKGVLALPLSKVLWLRMYEHPESQLLPGLALN